MKIVIHAQKRLEHHITRAESFEKGLRRHGIKNVIIHPDYTHVECDLAIFWGMHRSKFIRQAQFDKKKDFLVMERGYVGNRFSFTSLGYNGLNGRADFCNENSPSDRWKKYFSNYLKPWHTGKYVLLTGQVLGDASIKELRISYASIVNQLKQHTKMPIHFRKHPHRAMRHMQTPEGCVTSPYEALEDALAGANVCITVNSNSGVDAILAGTPVINIDSGSMCWELSQHDYKLINNPPHPDRTQWAYDIAYAQWTPEEIENGDAWEHLKKRYE